MRQQKINCHILNCGKVKIKWEQKLVFFWKKISSASFVPKTCLWVGALKLSWFKQWFSTGVPRNPWVPGRSSRGSANFWTNFRSFIFLKKILFFFPNIVFREFVSLFYVCTIPTALWEKFILLQFWPEGQSYKWSLVWKRVN